jgi:hypothetical protein
MTAPSSFMDEDEHAFLNAFFDANELSAGDIDYWIPYGSLSEFHFSDDTRVYWNPTSRKVVSCSLCGITPSCVHAKLIAYLAFNDPRHESFRRQPLHFFQ